MKGKATIGIMLMLSLIAGLFYTIPNVSAQPKVKIGIIGPVGWTVGDGMLMGAQLAETLINNAGGIPLSGGGSVDIDVLTPMADTLYDPTIPGYVPDPTPTTGTAAMQDLVDRGAEFTIGCFRTEAAQGAREVAMDNQIITSICGAATDELIWGPYSPAGTTIRDNYARYKYLFRNTPINSTCLVRSLCGLVVYGINGFIARLLSEKLVKIYGSIVTMGNHPVYGPPPGGLPGWPQVKYAVISEQPVWADGIHAALTTAPTYMYLLGPFATCVYNARVSAIATDVSTELSAAVSAGAELIIHIISGPVGAVFVNQWMTTIADADRPVIVGINVPGQDQPDHWTVATTGKCEYEAFLATAGTRSQINTVPGHPSNTGDYWDAYLAAYNDAPVYTSYGVYDTIIALRDTISAWAAAEGITSWPPTQAQYDLLIPYIEQTNRLGIAGQFKYTGNPNPGLGTGNPYPAAFLTRNPTMMGTTHDLFMYKADYGTTSTGAVRAYVAQWQGPAKVQPEFPSGTPASGRLEVVCPVDRTYSRRYKLPKWYYYGNKTGYPVNSIPLDGVDIDVDGTVGSGDAFAIIAAFFASPGAPNWNIEADAVVDGSINIWDALAVSATFWASANIPYP